MEKINEVLFISPMYNAEPHIKDLFESLKEQSNPNWKLIVIDDISTDNSYKKALDLSGDDKRIEIRKNDKKHWALKNVVNVAREFSNRKDLIVAVIDADDSLCNENTVDLLINSYKEEIDTVWTAHTWDVNNNNISKELINPINPYQTNWVSSHLKTWRANVFSQINDNNFQDLDGKWFKRGYDQALYLPLLYKSRKRFYLDETCYLYRVNSNSTSKEKPKNIVKEQSNTIRLVRSRGYVE